MAVAFKSYTVTTKKRLMYLEVKMPKVDVNEVLKCKQAIKKVPPFFL